MRHSPPSTAPSPPRLAVVRKDAASSCGDAGALPEDAASLRHDVGALPDDATWARYRDNLARHLIGLARELQSRLLQSLTEQGYTGLRPTFGPLLALVARQGRAPGVLATQLATSPQAASQLVRLAEDAGYLERRVDPADRRVRLVVPTGRGRALIADGLAFLRRWEARDRDVLGATTQAGLLEALEGVARALAPESATERVEPTAGGASIGLLPIIAVRIQRELMDATIARGHPGLKMSFGQILPLIGAGGARIHEIARLQQVSRQAISATALDLEAQGYLRRVPDTRDGRGVVLELTDRGLRLIRDSVASLDDLEARLIGPLGRDVFAQLEASARTLYRTMRLEEEIFAGDDGDARPAAQEARSTANATSERDLRRLATRLRRQLGDRDAMRLAALLEGRPADELDVPRSHPCSPSEADSAESLFRSNVR
ncbi:MAG: MarR family transcriptional regulator [Myxococcota bacterium]|nr:MarR family transcriptional regulator [Myxococcales bacterium]